MIWLLVSQSGLFLDMGAGPELGMGGASAAVSWGPSAVFWNPAGLGFSSSQALFFSHWEHFEGIRLEHLAWALPTGAGSFGLSAGGLYAGGLERRTGPSPEPEGTFSYYDAFLGLSYAKAFGNFSVGLSAKPLLSKIDDSQAFGFAADLGGVARWGSFSAGFALRNLGPGLKYEAQSTPLPSQARLGLGFTSTYLTLGLDAGYSFYDKHVALFGGFEARPLGALSLRLGYAGDLYGDWGDESLEPGALSGLTAGLEVRIAGLGVGYAFRNYENLGAAHRFYLLYTVSPPKAEAPEVYLIKARKTAESFYQEALDSYQKGDLEEALAALDRALVWDPEFAEAKALYDKIQAELKTKEAQRLVQEGLALYREGNYLEALAKFQKALEVDSSNAEAKAWSDSAQVALGRLQKKYAKGVQKLIKEGVNLYSKGKLKEALSKFYGALALDPGNQEAAKYVQICQVAINQKVNIYITKAQEAKSRGKLVTAASYVKKALYLAPSDTTAKKLFEEINALLSKKAQEHLEKGRQLYRRGKLAEAERELRLALKYDPSLTQAKNYLSDIEAKRKASASKPKAKKEVSKEEIEKLYLKGVEAYVRGDYEAAIAYWEEVLKLDPHHEKARLNIKKAKKKLEE